jgi:hypothetical protein
MHVRLVKHAPLSGGTLLVTATLAALIATFFLVFLVAPTNVAILIRSESEWML